MSYTDDTYGYYKSYYIAKAWLELALTEINNSSVWFSHMIYSWNIINGNNFDCIWCHFVSKVLWRSDRLSNKFWLGNNSCDETNALSLMPWWSMTIPMFYDNSSTFREIFSNNKSIMTLSDERNKLKVERVSPENIPDINIWLVFQSGSDVTWTYLYMTWLKFDTEFFRNYFREFDLMYGNEPWNQKLLLPYIVLSNPNTFEVRFCISITDTNKVFAWPTTKYFISSVWEFMGKTVWLQAIYAQPTPSFLINPYIGESTVISSQSYFDY